MCTIHIRMYTYICIVLNLHIHICRYTYTCIHIRIYIYIGTYTKCRLLFCIKSLVPRRPSWGDCLVSDMPLSAAVTSLPLPEPGAYWGLLGGGVSLRGLF